MIDRWVVSLTFEKAAASASEVHVAADRAGIKWDSSKPGAKRFVQMCVALTGKKHLDDMTQRERSLVLRELTRRRSAMKKVAQTDGHWRRLPPGSTGKDETGNPTSGRTWVRRKSKLKDFVKLYPHQESFLKSVRKLPKGGGVIAAHGTGTGKTVSAIAAFEDMKERGVARRALVIAPAGLRDNFLNKGVKKFTDSEGIAVTRPGEDPGDNVEYIVTSYSAFRKNPQGFIDAYKPDVIIADEFHRAGDPGGKTNQAINSVRDQVNTFIGLTASVVQNNPADVVPLVEVAAGKDTGLGPKKDFKRRHVKKTPSQQRGVFGGKTFEKELIRRFEIDKRLGSTIHYIEDLDATKKPTKETTTVETPMSKEQMKLYRMSMKGVDPKILDKVRRGEEVPDKKMMNVFTKLIRARQVSNSLHTVIADMPLEVAAERTPKIKRILDDVEEHIKTTPDAQIIIYTNIVHGGVDVLEAGLKARGVKYGKFIGKGQKGVTEETRQQAVNDYIEGKNKVIIITGAGAEGLSLGNTTLVALADGHYNPERIAQAEARGIRAGGLSHRPQEERKVQVRRYVSTVPRGFFDKLFFRPEEKSVEQFVYLTADRKQRLNRQMRDILQEKSRREERRGESFTGRLFGG